MKKKAIRKLNSAKGLNRRMFLKGAGATLLIPFLPSLLPREAWGQSIPVAKRYFNIVGNYDYGHHQHWFPTLDPLSQVYDPGNGDHIIRYQTLKSFAPTSSSHLSPIFRNYLNPYLDKMNIIRGLNLHTRIAHGRGHMLGNITATDGHDTEVVKLPALPTIDQVLAANANFNPLRNSPLLVGEGYSYMRNADGSVSKASAASHRPHQLFDRLFTVNGTPLPEGGNNNTVPPHPRRALLNRVIADYRRVRSNRNISTTDRRVLNNTMDLYSDILARLEAGSSSSSNGCSYSHIDVSRTRTDGVSSYNPEQHEYAYELYALIFAAAASCDLYRVFDYHPSINDNYFDRHPTEDFHQGHSHQPWSVVGNRVNHEYMGDIWRLYINGFLVNLVRALDNIQEANGNSILDNSLVHMTLESSTVHSDSNKPCLLIGSANGALTTGHYIDYSRRELGPHIHQGDDFNNDPNSDRFGHVYFGAHYNRILTTILRSMGLQPSDYENSNINTFFRGRNDGLIGRHNNNITNIGGYGHIGSPTSGVWYYSNSQLYSQEYANYNYHFYKNSLPFPPRSAA